MDELLPQTTFLHRLRQMCQEDERVIAALLYGSFTSKEADKYSDIECALFFDASLLEIVDKAEWVRGIAPLYLFFADDFGHYTAIFEGLIRGEFHFECADKISEIVHWRGNVWYQQPSDAILVDRTGALAEAVAVLTKPIAPRDTPTTAESLIHHFFNTLLFGTNCLSRGELARALDILTLCHRYLLWMARLVEGTVEHWATPSRRIETELSPEAYHRFRDCTARLDEKEITEAYQASWQWGRDLSEILMERHHLLLPPMLLNDLQVRLTLNHD